MECNIDELFKKERPMAAITTTDNHNRPYQSAMTPTNDSDCRHQQSAPDPASCCKSTPSQDRRLVFLLTCYEIGDQSKL